MKKIYFLVFALLISLSGMGQPIARGAAGAKNATPKGFVQHQRERQSRHTPAPRTWMMQQKNLKSTLAIKQRLDSMVYSEYDIISTQWNAFDKELYVYSPEGNNVTETDYEFDPGQNLWVPYFKGDFTYNGSNQMTSVIMYEWDESGGLWLVSDREDIAYLPNGSIDSTFQRYWDDMLQTWVNSDLQVNEYNVNGQLLFIRYFFWNDFSSVWELSSMDTYSYDINDNVQYVFQQNWDPFGGVWINSNRIDYAYNPAEQLITTTFSFYDEGASQWLDTYKEDYTYDSFGNVMLMTSSEWDGTALNWLPTYQSEFAFNNSFLFNDLILPYYLEKDVSMYFSSMLTDVMGYYYESGNWYVEGKSDLYYSPQSINAIGETESPVIRLFPNPAHDVLHIRPGKGAGPGTFELLDGLGRVVCTSAVQGDCDIPLDMHGRGLYIYRLTLQDASVQSGKLVIE
jgi:hypothetical protein